MKVLLLAVFVIGFMVSPAFAESAHNIVVSTDNQEYYLDDSITVYGTIISYELDEHDGTPLSYVIKNPNGNLVMIGSILPDFDGSFEIYLTVGGSPALWKNTGAYQIEFTFIDNSEKITFDYMGDFNKVLDSISQTGELQSNPETENTALQNEIAQLKAENKKLRNYNLVLQLEIEDLQNIVNEQIRIIMTYFS